MAVGFGLISAQRSAGDTRSWADLYREALDLVREAERLGYGSVWTTEHHFVDDGYMPSLLPMAAAMGAVTQQIEVATGVVLAPLYHPLRLAEDAATVSLLSGGRFLLGLGLGWSAVEFEAFGASLQTRGKAMDEILEILPQAWSGNVVTHHGDVYDLPEVAVRPAPERPPLIVLGGSADAAVRRAARRADGFFSNALPDELVHQVEVARAELEARQRDPDTFRWIYYAVVYPCEDPDGGWEAVRDHVWRIVWKYSDMEASAGRTGPLPTPPRPQARTEAGLRRRTILGTPEQISERLLEIRDRAGVDVEFVLRAYFPAFPYARQLEVLEQLAEMIPTLS